MKTIIIMATLILSTSAMALEDKCYKAAEKAAFEFVKKDDTEITTMSSFRDYYGSDFVEVGYEEGWQTESWSFYNTSAMVNVEVHAVKGKCFVKSVDFSQNDQD